jgi:hypothetical protein
MNGSYRAWDIISVFPGLERPGISLIVQENARLEFHK